LVPPLVFDGEAILSLHLVDVAAVLICGLFWFAGLIGYRDFAVGHQFVDFFDTCPAFDLFVFDAHDVSCASADVSSSFDQLEVISCDNQKHAARGPQTFAFSQPSGERDLWSAASIDALYSAEFHGPSHVGGVGSSYGPLSADGTDEPCGFSAVHARDCADHGRAAIAISICTDMSNRFDFHFDLPHQKIVSDMIGFWP
jgi:hypothetical protein